MIKLNNVFTKKKALLIVAVCAAALLLLILLRHPGDKGPDASTREGRQEFLGALGWQIDPDTEEHKTVRIPAFDDGMMADYNELMLENGFDLSQYSGKNCEQYCYQITNYPGYSDKVIVTLYVQGREVIGGDIHTAAINGFMHGLRANADSAEHAAE